MLLVRAGFGVLMTMPHEREKRQRRRRHIVARLTTVPAHRPTTIGFLRVANPFQGSLHGRFRSRAPPQTSGKILVQLATVPQGIDRHGLAECLAEIIRVVQIQILRRILTAELLVSQVILTDREAFTRAIGSKVNAICRLRHGRTKLVEARVDTPTQVQGLAPCLPIPTRYPQVIPASASRPGGW